MKIPEEDELPFPKWLFISILINVWIDCKSLLRVVTLGLLWFTFLLKSTENEESWMRGLTICERALMICSHLFPLQEVRCLWSLIFLPGVGHVTGSGGGCCVSVTGMSQPCMHVPTSRLHNRDSDPLRFITILSPSDSPPPSPSTVTVTVTVAVTVTVTALVWTSYSSYEVSLRPSIPSHHWLVSGHPAHR
jgi:hypothetical protein